MVCLKKLSVNNLTSLFNNAQSYAQSYALSYDYIKSPSVSPK